MIDFEVDKLYVVEGGFLRYVKAVRDRLYSHDSRRINADESRDMANALDARLDAGVAGEYKS